ncbi:histidinol-phosphate transaminase [Microterricola viridarii]|uniref:Aromatic amino acid aminotransferase n=1 Tax=Microterricola viridarii TaxID=412690 RepID=A0A1H1N9C8_9MICO|nr:histidinol-phosphate transaminase [Microterricola viridarii]SDR94829.1 histidinol-phosphate aminotransferase [Microterricola viridarii]
MVRQREVIAELPAYKQGATPSSADVFKLSSNENPFPPLPSVVASVVEALSTIHLYPAMSAPAISQRVAEKFGVDVDNVAFGAGSVEVAAQLIQASAGTGDEVIFAWRSFEAYPILVTVAGATPIAVPLTADDAHDLDAMADAITPRTRLIFVCNPNNPTGTGVTRAELERFLERVPADVLVVIDEAYVHFNRDENTAEGIDFFRRYPNIAVLHTFSKAYGLAGLRLGYAIAQPTVAANLRRVAVPFAVTDLAQRAAVASLDAEAELGERIDQIMAERGRVSAELAAGGWKHSDSLANFVWLRTGAQTDDVNAALTEHGVLARAWPGEGIRVSIGSTEANNRFLAAMATLQPTP